MLRKHTFPGQYTLNMLFSSDTLYPSLRCSFNSPNILWFLGLYCQIRLDFFYYFMLSVLYLLQLIIHFFSIKSPFLFCWGPLMSRSSVSCRRFALLLKTRLFLLSHSSTPALLGCALRLTCFRHPLYIKYQFLCQKRGY